MKASVETRFVKQRFVSIELTPEEAAEVVRDEAKIRLDIIEAIQDALAHDDHQRYRDEVEDVPF